MPSFKKRNRKGIALIVVLLALVILAAVGGGVVAVSTDNLMHAHTGNESLEALYAARAGAWHKLGQIKVGNQAPITTPVVLPRTNASYKVEVQLPTGLSGSFPPPDTVYVLSTGTSFSGKSRKVGILATISESRWNHAAFGNNQVVMKSGSYTDSFNSTGGAVDHSKASIATNNSVDGIVIEDHESVVIGWSQSTKPSGERKKKKGKGGKKSKLVAEANAQGPPGSAEEVVVMGGKGADQAYKAFQTGTTSANNAPVTMPTLPNGPSGVVDPTKPSTLPSVNVSGAATSIEPGAYYDLDVDAAGTALLDVSDPTLYTAGDVVEFSFHGVHLNGGALKIKQPPGGGVKVRVFVDSGDGSDPDAGVQMVGGSVINDEQRPIELQFMIAGSGTNTLEGHDSGKSRDALLATPKAYYVAYAPQANIVVNRGQIYGSVVANTVTLDGGSLTDPDKGPAVIHYDVSLLKDTGNPPQISVLSVRNF